MIQVCGDRDEVITEGIVNFVGGVERAPKGGGGRRSR